MLQALSGMAWLPKSICVYSTEATNMRHRVLSGTVSKACNAGHAQDQAQSPKRHVYKIQTVDVPLEFSHVKGDTKGGGGRGRAIPGGRGRGARAGRIPAGQGREVGGRDTNIWTAGRGGEREQYMEGGWDKGTGGRRYLKGGGRKAQHSLSRQALCSSLPCTWAGAQTHQRAVR